MSPLPERKKSAEELAKLRDSLGISGTPPPPFRGDLPAAGALPPAPPPAAPPQLPATAPADLPDPRPQPPLQPLPAGAEPEPKLVRSLKRSERIPVLPIEETPVLGAAPAASRELRTPTPLPAPQLGPKTVRSLRKSERAPLPEPAAPPPESPLPHHRHSEEEIQEIRRREALSHLGTAPLRSDSRAPLPLVIFGYLCAAASAVYFWQYDPGRQYPWVTAALAASAWLVALGIFFRARFSRHHAAFMAVIALFALVFAVLYYFPHLKYGS